ncbi:MAG: citryl-CoA lyase [Betaproteobacteria bacterium]|nr:citryl-CoA lyase [Betaproteobacteria bacterium]
MPRKQQALKSELGWSSADRITVRGLDLPNQIMGHLNLGDMAFLQLTGRKPTPEESKLFNAIAVTLVEHGMTPSAIAARMTIVGAPEALQAAVAAGLCGLGSVFVGSMEQAAILLETALPYGKDHAGLDLEKVAVEIVERYRAEKRILPGIGHPIHKPLDPRVPRLFAIAKETGFHGRYVELMIRIQERAAAAAGRVLPMNATGAIGALSCELGFPPRIVRGFGVLARAIGLVGHIMEEWQQPMALEIWRRVDEEASEAARQQAGA